MTDAEYAAEAAQFAAEQTARRNARKDRKTAVITRARAFAAETGLAEKLAAAPIVIREMS